MILIAAAFLAGVLTILSPCTLPVVPLVLGASGDGRRVRVAGVLAGFAVSFLLVTVVLAATLASLGATSSGVRIAAAIVLGAAGLALAIPAAGRLVEARLAPVANGASRLAGSLPGSEGARALALGGLIGLVWAPCVGPIMAAVIASTVVAGPSTPALLVAAAYVAGALLPMGLIALAGRRAIRRMGSARGRERLRRSFGGAMVLGAALVVTGLDLPLQARIASWLPDGWGTSLVAVEDAVASRNGAGPEASDAGGSPLPAPPLNAAALEDLGPAPELTGITDWINSPPLTLAGLHGKVVLVHFWTFGCINCIHVQPYVKAWYERYAAEGFVVVGVHTPELSFERDIGNVRAAVAKADVRFPVAFDPGFGTWRAYQNHYWPAFFFVDRDGRIRHVHVGEGDYAGSEAVIRSLLAVPAGG